MPAKQLPVRPDLDQYRKQAKELARACHSGDGDALTRLRAHHPQPPTGRVALSDAQLVLAREHGYESWPKFAAQVEQMRIAAPVAHRDDPVDAFLRAALVPVNQTHVSGTLDEANAILARYPHVAGANVYTAAVLGDDAGVRAYLARDAANAAAEGGPYGWDALLHLCFSRYLRLDASRAEGFTGAARALLDAGANPNAGWYEKPDHEGGKAVWESAIYGAAGLAQSPGVTRLLLDYGADPNDGETPYHAPESYDNTVLRILLESGKIDELGKSWILCRKADWHDYDGMKLALERGADPNLIPHWGNNALQHAIQRDNGMDMIRLLLDHGADPLLPNGRDGRNAAQMAARRGRGDVLRLLAEGGMDAKLDGADRLIGACAQGDHAQISSLLSGARALRDALLVEGGELLGAFAGVGNTEGVRCLLDLGVPADALYSGDAYFDTAKHSTAVHVAAWRGHPGTVRLLLERGARVNAKDGRGRTALQLAVRACADSYWKQRRSPEWVEVLLKAGASLEGVEIPCGYAEADELLRRYSDKP